MVQDVSFMPPEECFSNFASEKLLPVAFAFQFPVPGSDSAQLIFTSEIILSRNGFIKSKSRKILFSLDNIWFVLTSKQQATTLLDLQNHSVLVCQLSLGFEQNLQEISNGKVDKTAIQALIVWWLQDYVQIQLLIVQQVGALGDH